MLSIELYDACLSHPHIKRSVSHLATGMPRSVTISSRLRPTLAPASAPLPPAPPAATPNPLMPLRSESAMLPLAVVGVVAPWMVVAGGLLGGLRACHSSRWRLATS